MASARGIVRRFAQEGARIMVADLDEGGGRVIEECARFGEVIFQRTDASVERDFKSAIERTVAQFILQARLKQSQRRQARGKPGADSSGSPRLGPASSRIYIRNCHFLHQYQKAIESPNATGDEKYLARLKDQFHIDGSDVRRNDGACDGLGRKLGSAKRGSADPRCRDEAAAIKSRAEAP